MKFAEPIGSTVCQNTDWRTYPDSLRTLERYDDAFLQLLAADLPSTYNDLAVKIDGSAFAVLSRWLTSAEWRGLIRRWQPEGSTGPRRYVRVASGGPNAPSAA